MNSPSLKKYLVISIFAHLLIVGGLYFVGFSARPHIAQDKLEIDILNEQDLAALIQEQAPEKKAVAKKPLEVAKNQVVEQLTVAKVDDEVDSRFLSEHNQKVEKQTVAVDRGEFQNLKKSAPEAQKSPSKSENKSTPKPSSQELAKDLFKTYDHAASVEGMKVSDKKDLAKNDQSGLGEGADGGPGGDRSQTNDYIKDVDQGLETLLNTREFKYYSYYNRIRRQLAQHWEGRVREKLSKMFNEGRSPAAVQSDKITKLMIILNKTGTLVKVQVLRDSGISDLDEAAIEAFRAAAPFPNPPSGIIEEDGTVKIRWDFVIES